MPERATVTQAVQIGVEATPGTVVAANKQLSQIGFGPGIQVDMKRFRPQGQKFASVIVPGREWVQSAISGVGTYSEVVYLLSSILKSVTPVQQGGTTAYKWSFVPAARTEDVVKTLSIEQGSGARAHGFGYGLVTEFGLAFSRAGIDLSGALIGQRLTDGITMTGSPAAIEEKPILPTHVDVYLDSTSAALGTTKLTRVVNAGFTIGSRFNPVWVLDSTKPSFASHVETEPSVRNSVRVEADAQGMGPLADLRAGTTKYLRIDCTHTDLAGTAFPYKLTIDSAVKVLEVSEFSDEDGLYAIEWTYEPTFDAAWAGGKAFGIDVTNKQTTL